MVNSVALISTLTYAFWTPDDFIVHQSYHPVIDSYRPNRDHSERSSLARSRSRGPIPSNAMNQPERRRREERRLREVGRDRSKVYSLFQFTNVAANLLLDKNLDYTLSSKLERGHQNLKYQSHQKRLSQHPIFQETLLRIMTAMPLLHPYFFFQHLISSILGFLWD